MNFKFKKKYIPFIIITVVLLLILFLTPNIAKKSMLNTVMTEQVSNKEITKIEYIKYKSEPFMSVVIERKEIKGNDNSLTSLVRTLDDYKIKIFKNKKSTSEILYVYFKDGTNLICYIDGNNLGVDSGNIWIKNTNITSLLKQMNDVDLIKEI